MGGQDDDRIVEAAVAQLRLHVESRAATHAQVEQHAVDDLRAGPGEERFTGFERSHLAAVQAQQQRKRIAHRGIVVDDRDERRTWRDVHGRGFGAGARLGSNVVT